jgi:ABC-type polysaccharide/polyol phosphate transport system ATPase subunit
MTIEIEKGFFNFNQNKILKNFSLILKKNEKVFITGKNGCGKSTLSKILVGSLLFDNVQVYKNTFKKKIIFPIGKCLNSEFECKDNIYYLMSLLNIEKKNFSKIVEFAEIVPFLNTKLKYLSTGYKSRLSFSTIIFSNPDLIIIDEGLVVGDNDFVKKSASTIKEFLNDKSIIILGHNIGNLAEIIDKQYILENGSLNEVF